MAVGRSIRRSRRYGHGSCSLPVPPDWCSSREVNRTFTGRAFESGSGLRKQSGQPARSKPCRDTITSSISVSFAGRFAPHFHMTRLTSLGLLAMARLWSRISTYVRTRPRSAGPPESVRRGRTGQLFFNPATELVHRDDPVAVRQVHVRVDACSRGALAACTTVVGPGLEPAHVSVTTRLPNVHAVAKSVRMKSAPL